MNSQEKYWEFLRQIKYDILYLDEYIKNDSINNKRINIFMAIASSTSIAAWVIWQKFMLLWSIIIAGSQVINAIKPYLPYNQRIKMQTQFYSELSSFFIEVEYYWFYVSNGNFKNEEIHEKLHKLKVKKEKINKKYKFNINFPKREKYASKAKEELKKFLIKNYPEGVNNEAIQQR